MDRCLQTDGSFDFTKLQCWGHVPLTTDPSHTELKRNGWFDGTATSGRSLEALVWLFESTGQPLFLEVAQRIAEHHLEYSTSPDGTVRQEIISPENVGHNHSYHGTLRGLLLFGLLTQQREYVDVVDATYRNGIREGIVKKSGWTPHDLGKMRFANEHGDPSADPASAGDAAQLALWLALDVGGHDLLDDVERYVRARLLPSQITEDDKRRWPQSQITDRQIGVWGCHGACHAEKGRHPDVLASITHSLCDIYAHICTQTKAAIRVNLHFDYEDSKLKITSTRNQRAKLSVLVKQPGNIMIRVPQWAPQESVHLTIDAKDLPLKRLGHFAWISRDIVSENAEIVMSYDLPEQLTQEQMPSGKCYKFKWRGDEIVGVDPQDDNPLPFYPAMENDPK
jgi:hypothetical protein